MEKNVRYIFWLLVFCMATQCSYCGKVQSDFSKKVAYFEKIQNPTAPEIKHVTLPPRYGGVSQDDGEFLVAGKKVRLVCQQRDLKPSPQPYGQVRSFKPMSVCSSISRESSSSEPSCAATPEVQEVTSRLPVKNGLKLLLSSYDLHKSLEFDEDDSISQESSSSESSCVATPEVQGATSRLPVKSGLKRSPSSHNLLRASVASTLITAAFKKPRRAAQGLTVIIPEILIAEKDKPILQSRVVSSFATLHCNPCS